MIILKRNNWLLEILRKTVLMGIGEGIYYQMEEFSRKLKNIYKPLLKKVDLSPFQENPYVVIELVTTENYQFYLTNYAWCNDMPLMEILPKGQKPFALAWDMLKPDDWQYRHHPGITYNYPGEIDRLKSMHELIRHVNRIKIDKQMGKVRSRFELLDLR